MIVLWTYWTVLQILLDFYIQLLLLFALVPVLYGYFLPISNPDKVMVKYIGLGLLVFALIWTIFAQAHMKTPGELALILK